VEIYVTDDRLGGYFRRYQLALRMMAHGARTQTVMTWSGLTRDQLVTQRRRWGFAPEIRQRGPAPSAFHVFFRSRRHRSEAALFASLCHISGAITARLEQEPARLSPNLENGELFCDALEIFQEWRPEADLDFEHAIQLAAGVVRAEHVTLGWCSDCHGATLFEGCRRTYANCGHCGPVVQGASARQQSDEAVIQHHNQATPERNPDHGPEGETGTGGGNLESQRGRESQEHEGGAGGVDYRREERQEGEER
jgi:hypothetical protein